MNGWTPPCVLEQNRVRFGGGKVKNVTDATAAVGRRSKSWPPGMQGCRRWPRRPAVAVLLTFTARSSFGFVLKQKVYSHRSRWNSAQKVVKILDAGANGLAGRGRHDTIF